MTALVVDGSFLDGIILNPFAFCFFLAFFTPAFVFLAGGYVDDL